MLKSFIFQLSSWKQQLSVSECAALKVLGWCFTSRFSKRAFVPGILHGMLPEELWPAEPSSASLPTVPALTYLVPQQSFQGICIPQLLLSAECCFLALHSCFTLSCGNLLIYCAHGVGPGKWSGGSEVCWETAEHWNHLQLCSGKCVPLKAF